MTQTRTNWSISRNLAVAPHAMVAAKHAWAVDAALDVLRRGGNAVDAAVTVGFSIGVLEPWMSGLAGGGFMTVQMASGERSVIDFFSRAPAAATPDMFPLTEGFGTTSVGFGGVQNQANAYGPFSVATPGMVRGMAAALERFGTLDLADTIAPAIRFAEEGFLVDWYQGMLIASQQGVIRGDPETSRIFLTNGLPPAPLFGQPTPRLVQVDLARTLRRIAADGADGFYRGEVAQRIAEHVQALGGVLSVEDLAAYQPTIIDPLVLPYRDVELVLLPYQAGGTTIGEALRILDGFDLASYGHNSATALHLIAEASRRATADRLAYLGDPDFVAIDWRRLTSAEYAAERRADIDLRRASRPAPGSGIARSAASIGAAVGANEGCTTHFSVVDAAGNMVAVTQTLTLIFGSGISVPGTGVLLNDNMNLFDPRPGQPNSVAPRKRPASSMAHVIAVRNGRPFLAVGAPGGRRIMDTCLQMTLDVIDFGLDIQSACASCLIDAAGEELLVDDRLPLQTREALREMGHAVVDAAVSFSPRQFASPTGVMVDAATGMRLGGADPWAYGIAAGI